MTDLLVEHHCPQCGAPAVLEETDRLFTCGYCRVTSYLLQPDVFRYMLPHNAPIGAELVYVPYWRCRGMLFSCTPATIHQRIVDHSRLAVPAGRLPQSLGLRPQAMTLRMAADHDGARFLQPAAGPAGAVSDFEAHFRAALPGPIYAQTLIGETLSMIYAPFYMNGGLTDAVLNRPVGAPGQCAAIPSEIPATAADWPVRFVPTLCPNCGREMAAARDALSLACGQCRTLWRAGRIGLKRMKCRTLPAAGDSREASLYLPFWRITAAVSGIALASYADFARQANLPRVVEPGWEDVPFHFWTPAMKLSPRAFLRAACAMTLAQPGEAFDRDIPDGRFYPVKLPFTEAVSALKILMASLLRPRKRILPELAQLRVAATDALLVYVPFTESGHEYVHSRFRLCINKNMLALVQGARPEAAGSHFP